MTHSSVIHHTFKTVEFENQFDRVLEVFRG